MYKKFSHIQFSGSKLSSVSEVNEGKVPYALAVHDYKRVVQMRPEMLVQ